MEVVKTKAHIVQVMMVLALLKGVIRAIDIEGVWSCSLGDHHKLYLNPHKEPIDGIKAVSWMIYYGELPISIFNPVNGEGSMINNSASADKTSEEEIRELLDIEIQKAYNERLSETGEQAEKMAAAFKVAKAAAEELGIILNKISIDESN